MSAARFVILEHDHPFLHWDLLLEDGEVLKSWRLLHFPKIGFSIPAERMPDHRLMYLDYEGPVSGNRGTVKRFASGEYRGEESNGGETRYAFTNSPFLSGVCRDDGDSVEWQFS